MERIFNLGSVFSDSVKMNGEICPGPILGTFEDFLKARNIAKLFDL